MSSKLLQQTHDGILQQTGAGNFILLNGAAETYHITQENEWGIILEDSSGYLVTQNTFNLNLTTGYYSLTGNDIIELLGRELYFTTGYYALTGYTMVITGGPTHWKLKVVPSTVWKLIYRI